MENTISRLDHAASVRLAWRIYAQQGQCFLNAWRAVLFLADLAAAHYVEGVIVTPLSDGAQVVEHAWIETAKGALLDPTLALGERWPLAYFPMAHYDRADVVTMGLTAAALPYTADGASLELARQAAEAFASALEGETRE